MIYSSDQHIRKFLGIGTSITNGYQNQGDLITEGIQDPVYLGFTLKFDFYRDGRELAMGLGTASSLRGLLLPDDDIDSAINYLKRVNKPYVAEYVNEFQKQLKNIQDNKPWFFQTISGAGDLIKMPVEGSYIRAKDKIITVECLESLDM